MSEGQRVTGWRRLAFRAPLWLYRLGLGRLLPRRLLYLRHTGRKSGRQREAVLEVVKHDAETGVYYVASGFGPQSNWYRNLRATPEAQIQVGARRLNVTARMLSAPDSGAMMVEYAQTYPRFARRVAALVGAKTDGSEASYRAIGETLIPFVAFEPRNMAAS